MINIETLNKNLLVLEFPPLKCFKHPTLNLVFYPHQKCASTSYSALFTALQWTTIDISNINWDNDIVFAHIRDPLIRHRKGIVEGVCNYFSEATDLFLTPVGAEFLTNITIVESHSYTIEKWLGRKNAVKVNWIPLDINIDHAQTTFDFLATHGAPIDDKTKQWFLTMDHKNISTPEEIQMYNMLIAKDPPGEILRYIDFDRCLYDQVVHFYAPNMYHERIKYFMALGVTESDAQILVDAEVESGQYRLWFTKK